MMVSRIREGGKGNMVKGDEKDFLGVGKYEQGQNELNSQC